MGTAYAAAVGGSMLLSQSTVGMSWAVPDGTPWWTVLGHFLFFLLVFSLFNAFGEEMVYRCYPIEQFRDRPRWIFIATITAALLFASVHFVIGAFSLFWFVGLIGFAVLCTALYVRHRSLWLIVGFHAGTTIIDASLSGAWKMGGLFKLELSSPNALVFLTSVLVIYSVATWLVLRPLGRGRPPLSALDTVGIPEN